MTHYTQSRSPRSVSELSASLPKGQLRSPPEARCVTLTGYGPPATLPLRAEGSTFPPSPPWGHTIASCVAATPSSHRTNTHLPHRGKPAPGEQRRGTNEHHISTNETLANAYPPPPHTTHQPAPRGSVAVNCTEKCAPELRTNTRLRGSRMKSGRPPRRPWGLITPTEPPGTTQPTPHWRYPPPR